MTFELIKKQIAQGLGKRCHALGTPLRISVDMIETPPDPKLGDLAFPCFSLAKILKKSPVQLASELAASVALFPGIENVTATGPYVNFFLAPKTLAHIALATPKKIKATKEKVVIEYVSPNTNKPLHLGHVRNAVLGDSISRILEATGKKVVKTCLVNDRGIHICKSMIAYRQALGSRLQALGKTPREAGKKGDHFVGDYYVLFEQMFQKDESLMELAQECLQKWEGNDKQTRALWKKMNTWVLSGMKETYKRLGISFHKTYFESAIYDKGKDIILAKLKKGVVKKDETGAVYADLSHLGIPNKILLRRDGTALYITQDIYLALKKVQDFKAKVSLYVVGSEQNLYLQQLFAVLTLFEYAWAKNLHHISYGMVNLPEGKMKSREGTVVDADDILDDLERMATEEIAKRDRKLLKKEIVKRAKTIALSAVKFYMADVSPKSDMTFDPKQSIALQGRTGPYVLYTYARLKSILRKAGKVTEQSVTGYAWEAEKQILLQLLHYPDILSRSSTEYNPSLVAQYIYSLAQKMNDYYHATPVLTAPPHERAARLALLARTTQILKNGLSLLGISILEKM